MIITKYKIMFYGLQYSKTQRSFYCLYDLTMIKKAGLIAE